MEKGKRFAFLRGQGKKYLAILLIVETLILAALGFLLWRKIGNRVTPRLSEAHIRDICELATLKCYYHNVSEWTQEGYGFSDYGKKKIWIEYDGVITAGIKGEGIVVSEPDKNNVITVTLPNAVILEKDLDEDSMEEIDQEKKVFGISAKITPEDRLKAVAQAQENMGKNASENTLILEEARTRAKLVIEEMIVTTGKQKGADYTVRFVIAEDEGAGKTAN